ncbi:radical SAM protein [Corallococcus interemptor]|uniref:radical SAM protein n=1 Tax=Corallococcus TaxID=83461 RepID=UPI0035D4EBAB
MAMETNMSEAVTFDIVLKVAERCNLACNYCYYFFQEYDGNKNFPVMTQQVMDELPRFLLRSAEELNIGRFNVVLHGGEPLLLKKPRFDALCTSLRTQLQGKVDLQLGVQTNGVLIDEEWIDIFSRHNIKAGVSIDGSRELHNRRRPDHKGRGSYDAAVRGLRMLQDAVKSGRLDRAGALCVVHASDDSEKLLEHLVFELGVENPNLNFPRGGWDNPEALEWNQSIESHRKIVRYALDKLVYPKYHFVRGVTDILFALHSDEGARRNDLRAACRHYIATISSEGVVHVDDNLLGVDEAFSKSSLSIFGTSLKVLIDSPVWQQLNDAIEQVPPECQSCEWYRSCRSGDLFNRFSRQEGFKRKSTLCETLQMIHEEAAGYLVRNGAVTLEELAARLSRKPTTTAQDVLRLMKTRPQPPSEQPSAE